MDRTQTNTSALRMIVLVVEGAVVSTPARLSLEGGTVRLGTSARLEAAGLDATGDAASVAFAGGRLVSNGSISSDACALSLVGEAGDVLLDWSCASWTTGFVTSNGGSICVSGSGSCALTARNAGVSLALNATTLAFDCSGRIELHGGQFGLYKDVLPSDGELFVAEGATVELGGNWVTVRSLTGVGRGLRGRLRVARPRHGPRHGREGRPPPLPRGRDIQTASPVVCSQDIAPREAGRHNHLHGRERKGAGNLPRDQRVPREGRICVAVGRRAAAPADCRVRIAQIRHRQTPLPAPHRTAGDPSALLSRKNRGKTPSQPANRNWRGDTSLRFLGIVQKFDRCGNIGKPS